MNDTYADTADGVEIRPLPPEPVCACMNINVGAIGITGGTTTVRPIGMTGNIWIPEASGRKD